MHECDFTGDRIKDLKLQEVQKIQEAQNIHYRLQRKTTNVAAVVAGDYDSDSGGGGDDSDM